MYFNFLLEAWVTEQKEMSKFCGAGQNQVKNLTLVQCLENPAEGGFLFSGHRLATSDPMISTKKSQ